MKTHLLTFILLFSIFESKSQTYGYAYATNGNSNIYYSQVVEIGSIDCPDILELKRDLRSEYPGWSQSDIDKAAKWNCLIPWIKKFLTKQGINVQAFKFSSGVRQMTGNYTSSGQIEWLDYNTYIIAESARKEKFEDEKRRFTAMSIREFQVPVNSASSKSMGKYAFVAFDLKKWQFRGNIDYGYSPIIELSSINCDKPTVEECESCLKKYIESCWVVTNLGYSPFVLNTKDGYNTTCIYKSEKSCFFTFDEATAARQKEINNDNARGWKTTEYLTLCP